jgi:hypothetical protein
MRSMKRMTIATAAFGVVVAGTLTGLALTGGTAKAGGISTCNGSGTPVACTMSGIVISQPITIELHAAYSNASSVVLKWSTDCTLSGTDYTNSGSDTFTTSPAWDALNLKVSNPDQCTVSVTGTLPGTNGNPATSSATPSPAVPSLTVDIDSQQASASASASSSGTTTSSVHQSHGFAGTCMDDKGNSSSVRATVQIWTCNSSDQAQNWSYWGSELHHGSLCLNAKGNGKQGSKLILWTCNGSANEIWIHRSNGEMVEKANGYKLCIDDPGYSTRNGTQLIVYACHNTPNQHWSVP